MRKLRTTQHLRRRKKSHARHTTLTNKLINNINQTAKMVWNWTFPMNLSVWLRFGVRQINYNVNFIDMWDAMLCASNTEIKSMECQLFIRWTLDWSRGFYSVIYIRCSTESTIVGWAEWNSCERDHNRKWTRKHEIASGGDRRNEWSSQSNEWNGKWRYVASEYSSATALVAGQCKYHSNSSNRTTRQVK